MNHLAFLIFLIIRTNVDFYYFQPMEPTNWPKRCRKDYEEVMMRMTVGNILILEINILAIVVNATSTEEPRALF